MKPITLSLAALALCGLTAGAQTCQFTVGGSVTPGSTVTLDLVDSIPDSPTLLAVGETQGSTTFNIAMSSFTVDLDMPFAALPFGTTDANGDISRTVDIPSGIPASSLPQTTLFLQAVTLDFGFSIGSGGPPSFTLNTCVSNVESLQVGT